MSKRLDNLQKALTEQFEKPFRVKSIRDKVDKSEKKVKFDMVPTSELIRRGQKGK